MEPASCFRQYVDSRFSWFYVQPLPDPQSPPRHHWTTRHRMHLPPKLPILQSLGVECIPLLKPDVNIGLRRDKVQVTGEVDNERELRLIQAKMRVGLDDSGSLDRRRTKPGQMTEIVFLRRFRIQTPDVPYSHSSSPSLNPQSRGLNHAKVKVRR
jgi:hypothetical protein